MGTANMTLTFLFIFLLAFISIQQIYPAEVGWTRYYLESDKTRVVFFLDEIPKYETNYDEENNTINITLSDSHLGKPSKKFNINSAFISSISLKQADNNTVDIQISLPKPANYKVFDIKSPALIIVDVSSTEKAITETLTVPQKEQKTEFNKVNEDEQVKNIVEVNASITNSEAENKPNDDNPNIAQPKPAKLSIMDLQLQALELLNGNIITIVQYAFNLVVLFLVIYVIIKMRSLDKIAKYIRRNRRKLKDNPAFASILDEIERENKYNLQKIRNERLDGGKE